MNSQQESAKHSKANAIACWSENLRMTLIWLVILL